MAESVVITGMGAVCPIGVGVDEVWRSVESGRSGVRRIDDLAEAGWIAPFGGLVTGFEAKRFVKPRKSLKVMADEIQWAFAAGDQAWQQAGLGDAVPAGGVEAPASVDPERAGVVFGAGLMYCDTSELAGPYRACLDERGEFDFDRWGRDGLGEFFPLWMLKYLPNMSACHAGIYRDARGPTNTIAGGDTSGLLALGEAVAMIRRDAADVMLTGGSSRRLHMTDPVWWEGAKFWQTGGDPATACRPFDQDRLAPVCGEGAGALVVESRRHATRRGAKPLAEVLAVASRSEPCLLGEPFSGRCVAEAIRAAMDQAGVAAADVGSVNACGTGDPAGDRAEAAAIHQLLGDTLVTAPKSYIGNLGASGGVVELIVSLLGAGEGVVPATLNHDATAGDCPVHVAAEPTKTGKPILIAVNYNDSGQAAAAVLSVE